VIPYSIKQLAESDLQRHHWRGADDRGGLWLFETVEGEDQHWAIRQVEIRPDRTAHRYWSGHPQDEHGFLTEQAVEIWELTEITEAAFDSVWKAVESQDGPAG
jgi:hypothetical protein